MGFGGTLANLRGYILGLGGQVVGMTTLTETRDASKIGLESSTLADLREKHGSELEELWRNNFGYGLECCTELEASYLIRQPTVDAIRRRLSKAAKKAHEQGIRAIAPTS